MTHRIHQFQQFHPVVAPKQQRAKSTVNFKDVLTDAHKIKVSKHAKQRLNERNIRINDQQWQSIGKKMNEAKQKGVTDSLVVMRDVALLVSTKNNTIVTALDKEEATSRIFTNINGTILMNE